MKHEFLEDELHLALGLTDERAEFLKQQMADAYDKCEDTWAVRDLIKAMVPHINGEEESFFVAFGLGALVERCENRANAEGEITFTLLKSPASMSQYGNYKSASHSIVEDAVIHQIKLLNGSQLATLEILLDRMTDVRKQGKENLPDGFMSNPNAFCTGFFDVHSQIFVQMIEEYKASKVCDGGMIYEKAILLSLTSLYLAENMVASVDFSDHPAVTGKGAEKEPISNP